LLSGCRITPNIPVGSSGDWTTTNGQRVLGRRTLQTRRFFFQTELKFVVYTGFLDGAHEGSVEVHFDADGEACLHAAEELMAGAEVVLPASAP